MPRQEAYVEPDAETGGVTGLGLGLGLGLGVGSGLGLDLGLGQDSLK